MKKLFPFFICIAFVGCKDKYVPKINSPATGYLVVEGFINSGGSPSVFTLSRSTKLYDTVDIIFEENATVTIQGENQESYLLSDKGKGTYVSDTLHLDSGEKYRLHIMTQDGREYVSDYESIQYTPPIDSVTWVRTNDGIALYVSTHDPQTIPGYYRWDYDETWEIHSTYESSLEYTKDPNTGEIAGIAYRNASGTADTLIYKCWKSDVSTDIHLGSSEKLTSNVIFLPFHTLQSGDEKLSVLYSINLKQFALSKAAYDFYQVLKVNTEQLGSIFDPEPTSLPSNIHCVNHPAETVVGYVSVSQEQDKRIFIRNADVPRWNYSQKCDEIVIANNADSIKKYGIGTLPTVPHTILGLSIVDFYAAPSTCVDCTLRGTNIKPSFWP